MAAVAGSGRQQWQQTSTHRLCNQFADISGGRKNANSDNGVGKGSRGRRRTDRKGVDGRADGWGGQRGGWKERGWADREVLASYQQRVEQVYFDE